MSQQAICAISGQAFEISDKEVELCKRLGVPLPTLCPTERFRVLMAFRNEWKLYRRKCDATGENILSAYAPDSPYKVYQNKIWWGDTWDALEYGRAFDFSRSFFEQFQELQAVVPREGTSIFNCENCDYNSHIRQSRNCYLNSLVARCENLYYSYWMVDDKDVFDSLITNGSTLCYYCSNVNDSYQCFFVEESMNCKESYFCHQMHGCDHCIFSSNLANKSYYAFNKPCTKEEFEKIKNTVFDGSFTALEKGKKEFETLCRKTIQRALHNLNCENVTGDHLYNCRNCENAYEGFNSEDCVNSISLGDAMTAYSCYSAGWPNSPGPVYMAVVSRACQDVAFGNYNWYSGSLRYCEMLNACESCFGCIGLQHKKYCILNKQYTKEEYDRMVERIVEHMKETGEWGQFFPPDFSDFAYNETAAQDFFPLKKEEALTLGYRWKEEDAKEFRPSTIEEIPENIADINSDFTKEILACESCRKNYKIIEQELKFYKQMNLPIPRLCPDCRHKERFNKRNPFLLFHRQCDACKTDMLSTYSPKKQEVVYCEECYLKEVD